MSISFIIFALALFIATIILLYSIINTARWAGIKITIHNLPYLLFGTIVLDILIKGALLNPMGYFIMGALAGVMHFIIDATDTLNIKKKPIEFRLLLSAVIGLLWIHFLAYLVFYLSNSKTINEKLKS
jgi:hypothetical protein